MRLSIHVLVHCVIVHIFFLKMSSKEPVEFTNLCPVVLYYTSPPTQGVPVMAIRNKMISEGLNPDLLE